MNLTEAVKCLIDKKCNIIWRLSWGKKKESNRIRYNFYDSLLEFDVNGKVFYPSVNDLLVNDWQAVLFEGCKDIEIIKYVTSSKSNLVYNTVEDLKMSNRDFNGNPIPLIGVESINCYIEENDFYKAFYEKEKDDIIFELTSILDTTIDMVSRGQLISTATLNKARRILDKVSDGIY